MSEATPIIDYAPPRRLPAWATRRNAMLATIIVASALAAMIVLPRVIHRARLLQQQHDCLAFLAPPSERAVKANMLSVFPSGRVQGNLVNEARPEFFSEPSRPRMTGPARAQFANFLGYATSGAVLGDVAFMHGRSTASDERLVVVEVRDGLGRPENVTFACRVFALAGWTTQSHELVTSTLSFGAWPFDASAGFHILPGRPDPEDASRFTVDLLSPRGERATVVGHLLADDRVRLDFPKAP